MEIKNNMQGQPKDSQGCPHQKRKAQRIRADKDSRTTYSGKDTNKK
ncbi:MAG: hypothetical protein J6C18_12150 [Bacteroidaceae bacterium]|nr:hypothetical protein [Bacteroidaceae bacterium]